MCAREGTANVENGNIETVAIKEAKNDKKKL